ncbi:hypothetical protein LUZ62_022238 [Rhynchospora pubera]|uniref:Uncharacterized protein n=1 Tax=Rhynchospora pubera TaxID=906938 RepID=A0AAV8H4K2_9POAL|nr:hypothetical protein LUZ62_022238 [Rhynchospora pubera]
MLSFPKFLANKKQRKEVPSGHKMLESEKAFSPSKMENVKDAVAIDIDPPPKPPPLEVSLKHKLEQTQRWEAFEPFILSRVPHIVRETHKDLYEPRVVSIGPYHWGKESLQAMEVHKPRCLIDFLERNPGVGVEAYVEKIRELEDRARRCYSETINLSKDEFVEMLLLDGCFLLEFFYRVRSREPHILLDAGWGTKTIICDLLLFENQIPFFVVETLYSINTCYESDRESLLYLLHPSSISPDLEAKGKIYHLLHLYYQWFVPGRISRSRRLSQSSISTASPKSLFSSESPRSRRIISWLGSRSRSNKKSFTPMRSIPCATELREAGVTFRRKESASDTFDITFQDGVMEIPTLPIDSVRRVFYLNLAAFERSCSMLEHDLMSYVALMDSLINSNKDVVLLQRCGIINNMLLNEDEVAVLFNQLGAWSMLDSDKHYFASLFTDVQRYYNSRWHKYRAKLMHDYFSNPWSVLSVVAAIVLLVFSALQAIYGMYPYIHH